MSFHNVSFRWVAKEGVEPSRPRATGFESAVSAISPLGLETPLIVPADIMPPRLSGVQVGLGKLPLELPDYLKFISYPICWGSEIRTPIDGSKDRRLAIRRIPKGVRVLWVCP